MQSVFPFIFFVHMPNRLCVFFLYVLSLYCVFAQKLRFILWYEKQALHKIFSIFSIFFFLKHSQNSKMIQRRIIFFLKEMWKFAITFVLHFESAKKLTAFVGIQIFLWTEKQFAKQKLFVPVEEKKRKTNEISAKTDYFDFKCDFYAPICFSIVCLFLSNVKFLLHTNF